MVDDAMNSLNQDLSKLWACVQSLQDLDHYTLEDATWLDVLTVLKAKERIRARQPILDHIGRLQTRLWDRMENMQQASLVSPQASLIDLD